MQKIQEKIQGISGEDLSQVIPIMIATRVMNDELERLIEVRDEEVFIRNHQNSE